ncbi:MAG: deoxyguanosinetriphosphate triphosphohydrolase [Firmicutes bacterium]|jgi:dGTPase|nr:deoxyguanosinetriphosphate triphosphohydrolase [Bacillota bacterium]
MNIRNREENWEKRYLSPYAALSEASRGRVRDEPECEVRTVFQRDRDRLLHSKAFRRLMGKTQVFISPIGDHYRTRLTHTLEVAQISRTVARALRLNEALTEAIALGHDLGHTPFGHAGESALDQLLEGGFHHNEQSLRVVDIVEASREGRAGLNLTYEVRNGILCHTGDQLPATLEGSVVRICDRVAYINHDIDDAIRAGLLQEDDLPEECREVLGRGRRSRIDTMIKDLIINSWENPEVRMSSAVAHATNTLREFLFQRIYLAQSAAEQKEKIHRMITALFRYYMTYPHRLPEQFRNGSEDELQLLVADYIAGMTDRYALAEFEKLFLPKAWSL